MELRKFLRKIEIVIVVILTILVCLSAYAMLDYIR